MIPDWQFSLDPNVNPKINPFVKYPDGVYQTTPQSWGPYYGDPVSSPGVAGPRAVQLSTRSLVAANNAQQSVLRLNGVGFTNPFDSWWWTNRKWVALGGVGVVGLGLLAGLTAILK